MTANYNKKYLHNMTTPESGKPRQNREHTFEQLVARNAFLSHQRGAPDGYWDVPYRSGVAILHTAEDEGRSLVVSHLGKESEDRSVESFWMETGNRNALITSDVHECVGLSLCIDPWVKLLIHAQGAESLSNLATELMYLLPQVLSRNGDTAQHVQGKLEVAYNLRYLQHIPFYETTLRALLKLLPKVTVRRTFVDTRSLVSV